MTRLFVLIAALVTLSTCATAEGSHQPYKGFEARDIASLSKDDIRQLQAGSGWGLALPAELNGYPGPAHVLELADELGLSDNQKQRMEATFEVMRENAISKGELLIAAERKLDHGFKSGSLDATSLEQLIDAAEAARADLRYVHLSRHLVTLEVLDAEQVRKYSELRGYAADPCTTIPDGHDVAMWRRHNRCFDK